MRLLFKMNFSLVHGPSLRGRPFERLCSGVRGALLGLRRFPQALWTALDPTECDETPPFARFLNEKLQVVDPLTPTAVREAIEQEEDPYKQRQLQKVSEWVLPQIEPLPTTRQARSDARFKLQQVAFNAAGDYPVLHEAALEALRRLK
jgi:hypothetical protein